MTQTREYTLELSPQAKIMNRWGNQVYREPKFPHQENINLAEVKDIKAHRPISRDLYLLHQFPSNTFPADYDSEVTQGHTELSDQKKHQSELLRQQNEELLNAERARALFEKQKKIQRQELYRHELDKHLQTSSKGRTCSRRRDEDLREDNSTDFFASIYEKEAQRIKASRDLEKKLTEEAYHTYLKQESQKKHMMYNNHSEVPLFTTSDMKKQEVSRQMAMELRDANYKLMMERKRKFEEPKKYRASLF